MTPESLPLLDERPEPAGTSENQPQKPALECLSGGQCANCASSGALRDSGSHGGHSETAAGANETPSPGPFGATGPDAGRDKTGRFVLGNREAMVVGERSLQFWQAQDANRRDIVQAVVQDSGYTLDDAPRTLRLAADGIAQASLVRDAAFARMVESGGPLTSRDRGRRSLTVWLAASDRLLRHLQVIGLRRVPRPVVSPLDYIQGHVDE